MKQFEVERLQSPAFSPESLDLYVPDIDPELFAENLDIINETFRVIEDPKSGKRFEIAMAGAPHDPSIGVDCESSTYRSSLSNNPGNAVEFAENASLHPHRTRIYISSLGNGGSSYFDKNERRHLRKTGSFTHKKPNQTPEALPTIKALAGALKNEGLKIERISSNSAGGPLATALSLELSGNQLTHIHLKGRPNISKRSISKDMLFGMFIVENLISNRRNQKESTDPWKMSDELIEQACESIPEIYDLDAETEVALNGIQRNIKLYTDMIAYSKGASNMKKIAVDAGTVISPAVIDTTAMLAHHPKLKTTFHFTNQDRLYTPYDRPDEIHKRGDFERFLKLLQIHGNEASKNTEAILHDGSHADHTYYPSRRWAVEKYAFNR